MPNPESADPGKEECVTLGSSALCEGEPDPAGLKVSKCVWKGAKESAKPKKKKKASAKPSKAKYFFTTPPETTAYRWGPDGKPIKQPVKKKAKAPPPEEEAAPAQAE